MSPEIAGWIAARWRWAVDYGRLMVQKSHSQPPAMVLKPCKQWDKLPTLTGAGFLNNQQYVGKTHRLGSVWEAPGVDFKDVGCTDMHFVVFWCCMCAGCVLLVPHHGVFFAEVAKNMDRSLYRRLKSKNTKGCQRCIVRISSMHGLWCTMDVLCYTMVLFFIIAKSRNLFQTWKLEMFRSHFFGHSAI